MFAECCEIRGENDVPSESLKTNRFEITDDEANTLLLNAAWPRSRFCTPQSRENEKEREKAYANRRRANRCLVMCGDGVSPKGFQHGGPTEAAPRLDKYIVEFNIPTFFRGFIDQQYARRGARATQKPGTRFFE